MKRLITALVFMTGTGWHAMAPAVSGDAKAAYKTATDAAHAKYKMDIAKCDAFNGNGREVCVQEARAARTRASAEANAAYKNTPRAHAKARRDIADANFSVAKVKCEGRSDASERSICLQEAKAARATALANAKADRKITEARDDAIAERREAELKVELEKCDALSGSARNGCVAAAKAKYSR